MIKRIYKVVTLPSLIFNAILLVNIIVFQSLASAAAIKSTSLEVFKDAQPPFWEVSISCEGVAKPRIMTRLLDSKFWCSTEIDKLCDENKFSLSQQLCDNNFDKRVSDFLNGKPLEERTEKNLNKDGKTPTQETGKVKNLDSKESVKTIKNNGNPKKITAIKNNVVDRDSLIKEQIQIEEQRILIQQKRIELRRLELSLQKRKLNSR